MRSLVVAVLVLLAAAPVAGAASLKRDLARAIKPVARHAGVSVYDLRAKRTVFGHRAGTARPLASNTKLFTAAALLKEFRVTFPTVVTGNVDAGGIVAGDVFLIGYGDPMLERADIEDIARQVHAAGVRQIRGSVVGDGTVFEAPRPYDPDTRGVPAALVYDRGRAIDGGPIQPDPARAAASRLDDALEALGVTIAGVPRAGASSPGLGLLASHAGPGSREVAARMNKPSDNFVAEMITMALGLQLQNSGTLAAGVAAIRRLTARMGARAALVDGTGISLRDRATPREVADLLRAAVRLRGFRASLPVGGEGTLKYRMRATRGRCRAKTGTIPSARVSALSGYCGRYAFSILVRGAPIARAERAQDVAAGVLARK